MRMLVVIGLCGFLGCSACRSGNSSGYSGKQDMSKKLSNIERSKKVDEMFNKYHSGFTGLPVLAFDQVTKEVVLVDVREQKERDISMIKRAISMDKFESTYPEPSKTLKVAVYCTIGYRSGQYAQRLQKRGFNAYNLQGSILGWIHRGGKLTDSSGKILNRVHVYGESWNYAPEEYQAVY